MTIYVSTSEQNPVQAAIDAADNMPYQTDATGRKFYFQATEDGKAFNQIFCDDADGNDTIEWGSGEVGPVTPSNKIPVTFSC